MKNHTTAAIGARIANIRRSHNMTQEVLAEKLDVTPKHISHVENSTSCLSLKALCRLCSIFGCSMDYLVFGEQNNEALSHLPAGIIQILHIGSSSEIERLNRYLQIYVELQGRQ